MYQVGLDERGLRQSLFRPQDDEERNPDSRIQSFIFRTDRVFPTQEKRHKFIDSSRPHLSLIPRDFDVEIKTLVTLIMNIWCKRQRSEEDRCSKIK